MTDWSDVPTSVDPRAAFAPEVSHALAALEADVGVAVDPTLLDLARRRIATLLGGDADPEVAAWPTSSSFDATKRAGLALTEQFVIDVTGVDLAPAAGPLGDALLPFVQALWVLDLGRRTDLAFARLFGTTVVRTAGEAPGDLGATMDELLRATARLVVLDWTTTEIVRLRGARFHQCRLCQSLRTVSALKEGADEAMFEKIDMYEASDLAERHKVALRLTDAVITQPAQISDELVAQVRHEFTPAEAVELVCDIMRNAANKVAVAFGADAARITEGVELYDVLPDGDVVYGIA